MKPEAADWSKMTETLEAIRQEMARLSERVAALESEVRGQKSEARGQRAGPGPLTPDPCPLIPDEELILVISAAVAAYLGKKPHIQQIRLVGTTAWAQQGRVTIQASHALAGRHTRSEH